MVGLPFFKETEKNPGCCGCNKPLTLIPSNSWNVQNSRTIHDFGTHVVEYNKKETHNIFQNPVSIGDSYYNRPDTLIKQFENTSTNPYRIHHTK